MLRASLFSLLVVSTSLVGCKPKATTTGDGGSDASAATWTKTPLGSDIIRVIAVDPKNPKVVYIGISPGSTQTGYFRTKTGNAWTKLPTTLPDRSPGPLAISARDGTILVNPGVDGIWRSGDGGDTFARAATDPGNNSGYAFHPSKDVAWAITSQNGCYRSTDNGKTWAKTPNTGLPLNKFSLGPLTSDGTKLYLGTGGQGIYVSTDDGTSWTKAASAGLPDSGGGGDVLALVTNAPNVLFVQTTNAGLFRSMDGAATFKKLDTAGKKTRRGGLAIDPTNAQTIFVSANDIQGDPGGIFKSTNNGDTFVAIGPDNVPVESIAVASDKTIFVGTTGQGVWRLDPPK